MSTEKIPRYNFVVSPPTPATSTLSPIANAPAKAKFESAGTTPEGAPLDIRKLLDTGVERGDLELAQQPVARAEVFGVIARLRASLGDYEPALALLERQAEIVDLRTRADTLKT